MDAMKSVFSIVVLAVLFLMIGLLLAPKSITNFSDTQNKLFVTGSATKKVLPDVAVIKVNITVLEDTADKALELNNNAYDSVSSFVDSLDYNNLTLNTIYLSVNPKYRYDKNKGESVLTGYKAVHYLELRIPDYNAESNFLPNVLSQLVKYKYVTVSNLLFDLSDSLKDTTKKALIKDAMKDAWYKAKAIGDAGLFVVNNIPSKVTLKYSGYTPYPIIYRAENMSDGVNKATPITPKTVDLSVSVDTIYTYN